MVNPALGYNLLFSAEWIEDEQQSPFSAKYGACSTKIGMFTGIFMKWLSLSKYMHIVIDAGESN